MPGPKGERSHVKEYSLEMSFLGRLLPLAILAIVSVAVPAAIVGSHDPWYVLLPVAGIIGWNWWVVLTWAYRVVLHDDGTIEWVALARCVRTRPEQVREICPESPRAFVSSW